MARKFLNYEGLQHLIALIKSKYVQKDGNKMLSDNNYSNAEKEKLMRLEEHSVVTGSKDGLMSTVDKKKLDSMQQSSERNEIIQIKRNGSIISPADRVVNIQVPIKISELTNDRGFQTRSEIQQLINEANHMKKEIVNQLPATGLDNVLYLKGPKTGSGNIYDEYMWIKGKWEKIGDTDTKVDLTGYVRENDFVNITTGEINSIFGE